MDTIEKLCQELESILSGINTSGIKDIDPGVIDQINKLSGASEELSMKTGKKLIDNLVASLQSFKEGKSDENSVTLRITALDFYSKKVLSGEELEDL